MHKKLEDQRNSLIYLIEVFKPYGSDQNKISIVFDGKPGIVGKHRCSFVTVLFTVDETADEKIKRMVYKAKNKKCFVVVTNDKEIKFYVRSLGANVLSVEEFVSKIKSKDGSGAAGKGQVSGKRKAKSPISKSLEHKINQELEKIWLKKS